LITKHTLSKTLFSLIIVAIYSCNTLPKYPFDYNKKPQPSTNIWTSIVPDTIGAFRRVSFEAPSINKTGTAFYKKNNQLIFVSFTFLANRRQVKHYIVEASTDLTRNKRRRVRGWGNEKCVYYRTRHKAYIAWNRRLYYFEVWCQNDLTAFDEFMKAFPH
jgi:hypothetical protein